MDDLISRQTAIDALGERPMVWTSDDDYALGERNQYDIDRLAIETVPSVDVQPVRRGQWAEENGFIYCPFCGDPWGAPGCESMVKSFNYCPNCGARMDGE